MTLHYTSGDNNIADFSVQANNWEKALELYEDIKSMRLNPTVSTMNALLTALCKTVSAS